MLEEIVRIAEEEQVDLVLVAGDLYDVPNPSHEAQELFYRILRKLGHNGKRAVVAIAGNHDSPDLIEAPDPLARECGIILLGYPHSICPIFRLETGLEVLRSEAGFLELRIPDVEAPVRIFSTPFANEQRLRKYLGREEDEGVRALLGHQWSELAGKYGDPGGINLLVAHLFVADGGKEPPEEPEGEKPIRVGTASVVYPEIIPQAIQYAALGHLHRSQIVQDKGPLVAYSGSPLGFSFSESGQEKVVHLVELQPGKQPTLRPIRLESGRPLARKTFEKVFEALQWLGENDQKLVELTLRTKHFLTAKEMGSLREASEFLLNIIPEPTAEPDIWETGEHISLDQSPEELFTAYFQQQKGQEPTEEILALFRELLTQKES